MMRFSMALVSTLILGLSLAAFAQNVLVPKETSKPAPANVPTKPAPILPKPAPETQASTPQPQMSYGGQSMAPQGPGLYLSSEQQAQLILMEQRKIDEMQKALVNIQNTENTMKQSYASLQSAQPGTNLANDNFKQEKAQRDAALQMFQNQKNQLAPQYYAEIKKSQNRLALLQAGPLKQDDFTRLYSQY